MGARDTKLSGDDIYFIRERYKNARNKNQMVKILQELFLISRRRVLEIVGEEPEKAVGNYTAYTPEECEIILNYWGEGVSSVLDRLSKAGYKRSRKGVKNKHFVLTHE